MPNFCAEKELDLNHPKEADEWTRKNIAIGANVGITLPLPESAVYRGSSHLLQIGSVGLTRNYKPISGSNLEPVTRESMGSGSK